MLNSQMKLQRDEDIQRLVVVKVHLGTQNCTKEMSGYVHSRTPLAYTLFT